ncbi:FAD-dependent oxidoreductase [Veillonella sp.]|uniref:FAD-dependent oxidoreductase n=1 Tax=Veillonella sp. TaxID=1926307 RepID=UPI002580A432|nr:FAD-dependent oxidoreductase [Veillonella sp.]MBS5067745.1 FAD-dependent oxidoreductase [Veillonella sp.]
MAIDRNETFDVRLAEQRVKVLLIERGTAPGAKNMMGGRIYTHSLERLVPDFRARAPLERKVTKERISIGTGNEMTTIEYSYEDSEPNEESYVVLRAKFDKWLAEEAEKKGALLVSNVQVTELIIEGEGKHRRVIGVRCHDDEVYAKLVVIAEGSNTLLLEQAGLTGPTDPRTMAVGVKEVYKLKKEDLENRLMLSGDEGMAWLTLGDMTDGLLGGGFIYTNKDSLSVGMVVGLEDIGKANKSVDDMLIAFTNHPRIAPLLKNGQLKEHSAHLVPEGGFKALPKLGGNGYVIVGDAARMCMNLGYTIRGMDLAIESGMCAADAVNVALRDENMERVAKLYERQIKNSWLYRDMKLYKNMPAFLASNPRIFKEYPALVNHVMRDVFTVNGDGAVPMMKKLMGSVSDIGLVTLIRDAWKGVRSL